MALLLNFHRAARENRRSLTLDLAAGVSLGIRDAFSDKGGLVKAWLKSSEDSREKSLVTPRAAQFLASAPVKADKKDG